MGERRGQGTSKRPTSVGARFTKTVQVTVIVLMVTMLINNPLPRGHLTEERSETTRLRPPAVVNEVEVKCGLLA